MKYLKLFENFEKGSTEELVELLKYLPVNETAKYISEEILIDLSNYYINDIKMEYNKEYTYIPEDKCLKPYVLTMHYLPSNNATNIGFASENDIQLKYINKNSNNFKQWGGGSPANLNYFKGKIFNIIKHECSHFYLGQKDIETCLYHTHPDGMKQYYNDRQEIVLHSTEIYDDFMENYPDWKTFNITKITNILKREIKNLPNHTNIHAPFNALLQKKYLTFILKNYIKL